MFFVCGGALFFFLLLDGLGDHFGVLFGTKMWLKQNVFVCFCLGGPSGVSLVCRDERLCVARVCVCVCVLL